MKATHVGLGVKFGGRCLLCHTETGNRDFEKAKTSLYKLDNGKFGVVHPRCAKGDTKNSGNEVKYRTQPQETIELPADGDEG